MRSCRLLIGAARGGVAARSQCAFAFTTSQLGQAARLHEVAVLELANVRNEGRFVLHMDGERIGDSAAREQPLC